MDEVDAMILGVTAYEMFAAGWPEVSEQDAFGNRLSGLCKYVASRTLTAAPFGRLAGRDDHRRFGGHRARLSKPTGKLSCYGAVWRSCATWPART